MVLVCDDIGAISSSSVNESVQPSNRRSYLMLSLVYKLYSSPIQLAIRKQLGSDCDLGPNIFYKH